MYQGVGTTGPARTAGAGGFTAGGGSAWQGPAIDAATAAAQQQYLRDRLNQLEIPMSQAEQANLIAKMTGYWPGAGGGGTAMSEPQALDAIAKSRDDKFWNFYRANGWKTDTPEQKQTIVQNWIKSGDPRWKGKSAVQVAQDLKLGGTAGQGQKTFEREQWERSEEGRKFSQDLASRQFTSAEQAKAFGQALATKQFGSSEQARQFGQDMAERQFAAQQQSSAAQRRERMAELTGLYYPEEPGYAEPTGRQRWNQPRREPAYAEPTQGGFQRDINRMPLDPNMPAGPRPTGFTVDTPAQSNQLAVTFNQGRGLESDAVKDTLARLGVRATQTGANGATLELPAGREAEITEAIRRAGFFGSVGGGGDRPTFPSQPDLPPGVDAPYAAPTGDNPLLPGTQGGYWAEGASAASTSPPAEYSWQLPADLQQAGDTKGWKKYQSDLDLWATQKYNQSGEWPSDNEWYGKIKETLTRDGVEPPKAFVERFLDTLLENNRNKGTMQLNTPGTAGNWLNKAYGQYQNWANERIAKLPQQPVAPQPIDTPDPTNPWRPTFGQGQTGQEPTDWRKVPYMPEPRGDAPPPFAGLPIEGPPTYGPLLDSLPRNPRTGRPYSDEDVVYSTMPIGNGGVSYAGGSADFDERTGTYRSTGTDKPAWWQGTNNGPTFPGQPNLPPGVDGPYAAPSGRPEIAWNQPTSFTRSQPIETLESKRLRELIAARQEADRRAAAGLTGRFGDQDTLEARRMALEQAERERQFGLSQGSLTGSYNGQDTLAKQQMQQQGQQFFAQLLGGLSGPRDWVKYQAAQPQSSFGTVKAQPSYEGAFADFWNGGGRTGMPAQASDAAGNAISGEVLQPGKLKPQDLNAFEASPTKKAMQEGLWSAQGLDPNDMWARARQVQPTGQANQNTWWR